MNIHELEELLTNLESDRVERKASASDSKKNTSGNMRLCE